jgi:hypothetical protein
VQSIADLLGALAPQNKEKAEMLREKYAKEVGRYDGDKEDISQKARELEKERDLVGRRADRFDGGEALLEIGLVICSITLLTKRRAFGSAACSSGLPVLAWRLRASCSTERIRSPRASPSSVRRGLRAPHSNDLLAQLFETPQ